MINYSESKDTIEGSIHNRRCTEYVQIHIDKYFIHILIC